MSEITLQVAAKFALCKRRISSPRTKLLAARASTRTNVIPFPPHANLVTHGMPARRLGSDGKSSFCTLLFRSRQKRRTKYLKLFWVRPIFHTRSQ
jgi:hypothetical protein